MASSNEYHDYVLELLANVEGVRTRKMMGEYVLYLDDVVVGGIYDDELLLKPNQCLDAFFPDAQRRLPYEGSKTMMIVVDSEDPSFLADVFESLRK
ncbi:MAG: TfoX/Sxy family protein [Coriobacteriales bacterium]